MSTHHVAKLFRQALFRKAQPKSPENDKITILQSLYQALKSLPISFFDHPLFRTTPREPHTKVSIYYLPNEVLLEIFSFLELKPYILCHGVCKKWRQLLPSTHLHPTRKRLLALYRRILGTEGFQQALVWTEKNLQPFDREEYISCLLRQYPVIPEEFRMWILEWPAQLIIQCTWPGLPFIHCRIDSQIVRRIGVNWIAYRSFSPQLSSLVYKYGTPSEVFIPALFIWRLAEETDWLVFEQDDLDVFGRVFMTNAFHHTVGTIPYYPPMNDDDSSDEEAGSDWEATARDSLLVFEDWIKYLEHLWDGTIQRIQCSSPTHLSVEQVIPQPVPYFFNRPANTFLPAPAWDSCQRTVPR